MTTVSRSTIDYRETTLLDVSPYTWCSLKEYTLLICKITISIKRQEREPPAVLLELFSKKNFSSLDSLQFIVMMMILLFFYSWLNFHPIKNCIALICLSWWLQSKREDHLKCRQLKHIFLQEELRRRKLKQVIFNDDNGNRSNSWTKSRSRCPDSYNTWYNKLLSDCLENSPVFTHHCLWPQISRKILG